LISSCTGTPYTKIINETVLVILDVGDVTVDEEGVEWVVRQCFCESVECIGKSFKRLDGKYELDAWDKGRPL
jgi:hypothetical protein